MCFLGQYSDDESEEEREAVAKYKRRGWPAVRWVSSPELQEERRVGDRFTWVIALESDTSADAEVESIRFEVSGWRTEVIAPLR